MSRARAAFVLPPICTGPELARAMGRGSATVWRYTREGIIPKSCYARIGTGKQVRYFTAKLRAAGLLPEVAARA